MPEMHAPWPPRPHGNLFKMQIYYKTVSESMAARRDLSQNWIVNSTEWNYGKSVGCLTKNDRDLFDSMLATSVQLGASLEDVVKEGLAALSFDPRLVPAENETFFRLALASETLKNPAKISVRFWEYLYEQVRVTHSPSAPSRLESFFACRSLEDVNRYRQLPSAHLAQRQVLCKVVPIEPLVQFDADMMLTELVEPQCRFEQAEQLIAAYWAQETSPAALNEVLLQGSFVFEQLDW